MARLLAILTLLALCFSTAAQAQTPPVALLADQIRYDTGSGTLVARGNVQVVYGDTVLSAAEITYDQGGDRLQALGPIRLVTPDGTIFLADMAMLSPDLRNGLITGARLLINRQFQLAASEVRRIDGRYNTLQNVVASSCQICASRPIPVWQIRAARVVHDTEAKRIYFEDAELELFGTTVAYLPRLRIPDPSVRRASGFLVPELNSSDIGGYGVKLPYYVTLGDHADATFTPYLTHKGAAILELEYRQRFALGRIETRGALAFADGLSGAPGRGFIDATGHYTLWSEFEAEFALNLASDKSFLRQFDYSDSDRLTSWGRISRYRNHEYLRAEVVGFQSLRDGESDATIPLVLPDAAYRRVWTDTAIGGRLGLDAQALSIARRDGRDVIRLSGSADWRRDWTGPVGLQMAAFGTARIDLYQTGDDGLFPERPVSRFSPLAGVELRWPLVRATAGALHVLEPVVQLIHSEEHADGAIPNEDSLLPEIDETNLFALSRFPGHDRSETGTRLNLGVHYTRYDPDGWNLGLTLGQVLRAKDQGQFSDGSGLSGHKSDYVTALTLDLPGGYHLLGRGLFDDLMRFRRSELEFSIARDRYDLRGSYVFLAADPTNPVLGPVPERHEMALSGSYQISRDWRFAANWRHDLATQKPVQAGAGLQYANECIKVDLSLSRRFTTSSNVPPSTNIGLSLQLANFGGSSKDEWPASRCGATGLQ